MSMLKTKPKKGKKSKAKMFVTVDVDPKVPDDLSSNTSSDLGSDVEIVAQQRFPSPDSSKNSKRKKKKKKTKLTIQPKQDEVSTNASGDETSSVQNVKHLQPKNIKKKRKKGKDYIFKEQSSQFEVTDKNEVDEKNEMVSKSKSKVITPLMGKDVPRVKLRTEKGQKKKKEKKKVSNGTETGHVDLGTEEEEEREGKKRKINEIFEEAEICMEEAVPNKLDKVRKLLMKGTTTEVVTAGKERGKKSRQRKRDYEDLSFKKSRTNVDAALLETTGEGISSGLSSAQKVLASAGKAVVCQETKLPDIDPNKFIPVKTQKLKTAVPNFEEAGDSESEDEEDQRMNLMEAFADDDIADEFMKEKEEAEEESKPKTVDLRLPGWGSWGGTGISMDKRRNNKQSKLLLKFPGAARQDRNKKLVIVNDLPPTKFRKLQVDDLPCEYPSVASYEASIRAPIGNTWVPEAAHKSLTAPPVITKMGAIIEPMDDSHLLRSKKAAEDEAQKNFNKSIKTGKPVGRFKNKKLARPNKI